MADQEILQVDDNQPNDAAADAEANDSSVAQPDASEPEAFVNNGLEKWLAAREAWCRRPTTTTDTDEQKSDEHNKHKHAIPVDVDGIIDVLFDPRWRGGAGGKVKISPVPPRFPKNVPLPQMIDVLTDLWEAEGLDV